MSSSLPVLVVDDERAALQACQLALRMGGIEKVLCCQDPREAVDMIAKHEVGVVLLDLLMPHISGQELLARITLEYPAILVIVVTSANDLDTAVACMKAGAFDYMLKPVERGRLLSGVRRAFEACELRRACSNLEERLLRPKLHHPEAFSAIVTQDPAMYGVFQCVEAVATTSRPVLVTGQTGVGKELVAKALHSLSGRRGKYVALNVAGLDDSLFSDTLFGHKRGAFTGADTDRSGLIEEARGGTLFLDEIGDLSPVAQIRLLRLIQEYEYFPLGTNVPETADVRVIVATHQNLAALQEAGKFRKDLYYRVKCHHIHIPPLSARKQDISVLVEHFLDKAAAALNKRKPTVPRALFDLLATYSFPGNVRELESIVFDAVSKHSGGVLSTMVFAEHIGADITDDDLTASGSEEPKAASLFVGLEQLPTLDEADHMLTAEALRRANNNQSVAARLLGISQPALSKRLKRLSP